MREVTDFMEVNKCTNLNYLDKLSCEKEINNSKKSNSIIDVDSSEINKEIFKSIHSCIEDKIETQSVNGEKKESTKTLLRNCAKIAVNI